MAASYYTFRAQRLTTPDPEALLAMVRAVAPTAGYSEEEPGFYRLKVNTPLTPQNITAIQNAFNTAPEWTPQRRAQTVIDKWPIELKALVLTLIDEINRMRALETPPKAAITPAQALAAVRNKAATL